MNPKFSKLMNEYIKTRLDRVSCPNAKKTLEELLDKPIKEIKVGQVWRDSTGTRGMRILILGQHPTGNWMTLLTNYNQKIGDYPSIESKTLSADNINKRFRLLDTLTSMDNIYMTIGEVV